MQAVDFQGILWRKAVHESGHALAAYLHAGEVGGIRLLAKAIDGAMADCEFKLRANNPEWLAMAGGIVALSGVAAEALLCGGSSRASSRKDAEAFQKDLQGMGSYATWNVTAAELAFKEVARDILRKNQRMLYDLAHEVAEQKHVYGQDCMAILAQSKKQWGISPPPLMQQNWQDAMIAALKEAAEMLQHEVYLEGIRKKIRQKEARAGTHLIKNAYFR